MKRQKRQITSIHFCQIKRFLDLEGEAMTISGHEIVPGKYKMNEAVGEKITGALLFWKKLIRLYIAVRLRQYGCRI